MVEISNQYYEDMEAKKRYKILKIVKVGIFVIAAIALTLVARKLF